MTDKLDLSFGGDFDEAIGKAWEDEHGRLFITVQLITYPDDDRIDVGLFDRSGNSVVEFTSQGVPIHRFVDKSYSALTDIVGPYVSPTLETVTVAHDGREYKARSGSINDIPDVRRYHHVYELSISSKDKIGDAIKCVKIK